MHYQKEKTIYIHILRKRLQFKTFLANITCTAKFSSNKTENTSTGTTVIIEISEKRITKPIIPHRTQKN